MPSKYRSKSATAEVALMSVSTIAFEALSDSAAHGMSAKGPIARQLALERRKG